MSARPVLVTDLDGTLLGPDGRPGPAGAALARLQAAGVAVVFCSSKTRAEQEPLRAALGVRGPFIVENGAALLFAPDDPAGADLPLLPGALRGLELGRPAERVRAGLRRARATTGVPFTMFSETPPEALAARAGLDPAAARRARRRDYSETVWGLTPEGLERLGPALSEEGLRLVSGGRFHTATDADVDKGRAVRRLRERLERGCGPVELVGVGDAENDRPLLEAVDRAFVVARGGGDHADLPGERLAGVGPAGWAELAGRLLARADGAGSGPGPARR